MMDHRQIADARRDLEHARREKVRELMAPYDKAHDASLQALHDACGRIGHHWTPMDFGTDEDPVFCRVCGAAK